MLYIIGLYLILPILLGLTVKAANKYDETIVFYRHDWPNIAWLLIAIIAGWAALIDIISILLYHFNDYTVW